MRHSVLTVTPRRFTDLALVAIVTLAFYRVPSHLWFAELLTVGNYKISITEFVLAYSFVLVVLQKFQRLPSALVLFGVALVCSVMFSGNASDYFLTLIIGIVPLMLAGLLANERISTNDLIVLLKILFVAGLVFLVLAVTTRSLLGLVSEVQTARGLVVVQEMVISIGGEDHSRLSMPGLDKNKFAMQMTLAGLIGLFFWKTERRRRRKIVYFALSSILLSVPLWAFSKGAFISSLLGVAYLLIVARWFKLSLVLSISLLLVLLSLLYTPLLLLYAAWIGQVLKYIPGINFVATDLAFFYDVWDTSDRFVALSHDWELFRERPLIGVGYGSLEYIQPRLFGASEHNYYIRILVETGLIGFGVFLYLVANQMFWIRKIGQRLSRFLRRRVSSGDLGDFALLGQLFVAMYITLMANLIVAPADYNFWIVTGLIILWRRYGTAATAISAPGGHGVRYNQQSGARSSARAYQTGRRKHYR